MSYKVERITYSDVLPFEAKAKPERVTFRNNQKCEWFGIRDGGALVSFYCLEQMGKTARFKSNYTVPEFRRKGCLSRFIEHAKLCCLVKDIPVMTAFCTPLSVGSHLRHGAREIRKRGDITFVQYRFRRAVR